MRKYSPAFLLLLSLLLAACGNADRGTTGKKSGPNPTDQGQSGCPASAPTSFHRITLHFPRALPPKLGLKLDIDKDVRFSECASLRQTAPYAVLTRTSGTNDLTVEIDHFGFYSPLPRDVSFDILDLENCGNATQPYYSLKAQPLFWKMDFPNGPACAGRAVAIVEVIPGLE